MLYILIALLITAIIGYCVETLRMKLTIERVKRTSRDMAHFIDEMIVGVDDIDMFLINSLRQKITAEYLKTKRIDDFKIYKNGSRRIRVALGLNWQYRRWTSTLAEVIIGQKKYLLII